ncbi:MAG TPA: hypothetical protein VN774_00085 [Candidatus Limnocylindrales bacterium]|nr:hypothetical protein [Candidatus Limnocylindrales bacterium]
MMASWVPYFVLITAVAFVLQTFIFAAMYFNVKRTSEQMTRIANDLHGRINPIISRIDFLIGETQPRLINMVTDASEVVHIARSQAQKVDRVLTETLDRMRIQLVHADQILSGTLEYIDEAGSTVRRTLLGPVQHATAVIRGIKTGLEALRSFRRPSTERAPAPPDTPDEGMFI